MKSLEELYDALTGKRGEDQRRIAETGLSWLGTLLHKNADYGSSAWKPPVLKPEMNSGDAILVRMSDKIERLSKLAAPSSNGKSTKPEVADERYEDTISDLGSYCLLWLARPK